MLPVRFSTSALIAGTASLLADHGPDVPLHFYRTYSITVVGSILLDLVIRTQARQFDPNELVQHVEAVIVDDLKLYEDQNPEFQSDPMRNIVFDLYEILRLQVYPNLATSPLVLQSARMSRINYTTMEITFTAVERFDGS